jgi:glycosyltransferase involved in cell wall biosynthesis
VPHVLLLTEGTYPFVDGGVSTWCNQIIGGMPDVRFTVLAVTGDVGARRLYDLPPNADVRQVPLWGVEHPIEWGLPVAGAVDLAKRRRRSRGRLAVAFAELLSGLLDDLAAPEADPIGAGRRLAELHRFFIDNDYVAALTNRETWDAFQAHARTAPWASGARGTDLVVCLRWLRALLMPLALPIPEADISHATLAGLAAMPGVVARIERGTPLLVTEHGVYLRERYLAVSTADLPTAQRRFLLAIAELTAAITYAYADVISPVCVWNTRWERQLGARADTLKPICNGVDVDAFQPQDKPATSAGWGRPTAVAAARVFPLKDIENMIRAAAVTRRVIPDVLFLLYGSLTADPPYVERCRALIAELELEETFVFAGLAPEPTEIFNQGDIGVLSSVSEAFPFTVLEALACARPVAATDVGGVSEILDGWGELVPPRDPEALGAACVRLLADSHNRANLGRRGRERVLSRFRSSFVVDSYRGLYRDLENVAPVADAKPTLPDRLPAAA